MKGGSISFDSFGMLSSVSRKEERELSTHICSHLLRDRHVLPLLHKVELPARPSLGSRNFRPFGVES